MFKNTLIKKSFLIGTIAIGSLLESCGGGSSSNGLSSKGCYILSSNINYPTQSPSYIGSSITNLVIPYDFYSGFISLSYICSNSNGIAPLNGFISSASLCLSGSQCYSIPLVGQLSYTSLLPVSFTINAYKYNMPVLQTNPYQGYIVYQNPNSTFSLISYSSITSAYNYYGPTNISLSSNIAPGSVVISGSYIVSNTTSNTVGISCIDNSNGQIIGNNCSGSINYQSGSISSFSINFSSGTVSLPVVLNITYSVSSNSSYSNQNIFILPIQNYATLPYYAGYLENLVLYPYAIINGSLGCSTTQSTSICSMGYNQNGFLSITVSPNISVNSGSVVYMFEQIFTLNPSYSFVNHLSTLSVPAYITLNVTMEDGEVLSVTQNFNLNFLGSLPSQ